MAPKLKYLPVPRGSIVVTYGMGDMTEEESQEFVERLIVATQHTDFVVLDMPDRDAEIDVITRDSILEWLDKHSGRS